MRINNFLEAIEMDIYVYSGGLLFPTFMFLAFRLVASCLELRIKLLEKTFMGTLSRFVFIAALIGTLVTV